MANKTKKSIDIFINAKAAGSTIGNLRKEVRFLRRGMNGLTQGTKEYEEQLMKLRIAEGALKKHRDNVRGVGQAWGTARKGLGGFKEMAKGVFLGGGLLSVAQRTVSGIGTAISNWIGANKELEKSLSTLQSLTGVSNKDLEVYKKNAIDIGKETTLSATQIVDGFKLVGSAQPELLKTQSALIGVTQDAITLAEAADTDLATSVEALTGTMNQYNKTAEESAEVTNVIAAGSKVGAANIQDQTLSLQKFGAVAAANNVTLEESVGIIETLAEKNIKQAEAGTKVRNVLTTLSTIQALPPEAAALLDKYSVNLEKIADTSIPVSERLEELSKISADQTALVKVFGKENLVAGQILLQNADKVQQYTDAVTGTNTAQEQARINTDNWAGDLKGLDSAWEGFVLTIGGGESVLRPFTQGLTNALNRTTEFITALDEGDELGIQEGLLRLTSTLPIVNNLLGDTIARRIRQIELAKEVVDGIREEATQLSVLTQALQSNNNRLKEEGVTQEEVNELQKENAEIIDQLQTQYPEFTKDIDLHTASNEQLSEIQQQITDNLVEQQIEQAKVAERQRILNDIIQESISLSKLEMDAKDAGFFEALEVATSGSNDFIESKERLEGFKDELNNLNDTFENVEKTVKDLDLNFGAGFEANEDLIIASRERLKTKTVQLAMETNADQKAILEAEIEAEKQIIQEATEFRKAALDEQLLDRKEASEAVLNVVQHQFATLAAATSEWEAKEREKAKARAEERQKIREKETADALKLLKDLQEKSAELQKEFANEQELAGAKDDNDREMKAFRQELDAKFDMEIEAAEALAARKDEIGQQAEEQRIALVNQKELELQTGIAELQERFRKEKEDKDKASAQKTATQALNLEEATNSLRVLRASIAAENIGKRDKEGRLKARQELDAALIEQAQINRDMQINNLQMQLDNEEITQDEFNTRKLEQEELFQEQKTEIVEKSEEERKAMQMQSIQSGLQTANQFVDAFNTILDASQKLQLNRVEKDKQKRIGALEEEFKKGAISKAQFEEQKLKIEEEADKKAAKIKTETAKKQKIADLIQAAINTALGVTSALGSAPPPANFILAALTAAAGAVQIAAIASQPAPQFAEGGFAPGSKVTVTGASDGKQYNATTRGRFSGITPPGPSLLVGEAGQEYIVPNPLLSNPVTAPLVNIIERVRTGKSVPQFQGGGPTQGGSLNTGQTAASDAAAAASTNASVEEMVQQNTAAINRLSSLLEAGIGVKWGQDDTQNVIDQSEELAEQQAR